MFKPTANTAGKISAKRQFKSFSHQKMLLEIELYFLGNWNGEKIYIHSGSNEIFSIASYSETQHFSSVCSNLNNIKFEDRLEKVSFTIEHSAEDFDIEISSEKSEWAFRGLNISLELECPSNSLKIGSTECQCLEGFYRRNISSCTQGLCFECGVCPEFCKTCESATVCNTCEDPFLLNSDKACLSVSNKGSEKISNS